MPAPYTLEADLNLLRSLVQAPGVSGYEDRVREEIRRHIQGLGRVEEDRVGNLILHLGGKGPRLLIAAHMDELGLVVTGIEDSGLLAFRKLGGLDDIVVASSHVIVHTSKGPVEGVVGVDPPHIRGVLGERDKQVTWKDLRIDIGASSRDEALEMGVRILDPVTFKKHFTILAGGKYVATRALDDRAGCSALVQLARLVAEGGVEPGYELILAWTVQEEVGLRGARALASEFKPDYFVAVDTISCCHPVVTGQLRVGGGPALRGVDNYYIAHPKLARAVVRAAERARVPLQLAAAGGGTDAAAYQLEGVPSVAVSAPLRYTHSLAEVMSVSDYEGWIKLLAALAETPVE